MDSIKTAYDTAKGAMSKASSAIKGSAKSIIPGPLGTSSDAVYETEGAKYGYCAHSPSHYDQSGLTFDAGYTGTAASKAWVSVQVPGKRKRHRSTRQSREGPLAPFGHHTLSRNARSARQEALQRVDQAALAVGGGPLILRDLPGQSGPVGSSSIGCYTPGTVEYALYGCDQQEKERIFSRPARL